MYSISQFMPTSDSKESNVANLSYCLIYILLAGVWVKITDNNWICMGEAIDQAESGRGVVFSYVVILPENDWSWIFLHSAEAEQSAIEKNYHTAAKSRLGYYLIFNHFKGGTNQNVILFITLRFFKKTWVLFSTREKVGLVTSLRLLHYWLPICIAVKFILK